MDGDNWLARVVRARWSPVSPFQGLRRRPLPNPPTAPRGTRSYAKLGVSAGLGSNGCSAISELISSAGRTTALA